MKICYYFVYLKIYFEKLLSLVFCTTLRIHIEFEWFLSLKICRTLRHVLPLTTWWMRLKCPSVDFLEYKIKTKVVRDLLFWNNHHWRLCSPSRLWDKRKLSMRYGFLVWDEISSTILCTRLIWMCREKYILPPPPPTFSEQ